MSDACEHHNDLVLDHFLNPRNVGDLPDSNGTGEVGAVACGDVIRISVRVDDGRIAEARFRTFGCGTAIAASSVATELVKGRTVAEALNLSSNEVSEALGGLPPAKSHCPVLAQEAVKAAVSNYLRQQKEPGAEPSPAPTGPATG